jgi:hypothetical protein
MPNYAHAADAEITLLFHFARGWPAKRPNILVRAELIGALVEAIAAMITAITEAIPAILEALAYAAVGAVTIIAYALSRCAPWPPSLSLGR